MTAPLPLAGRVDGVQLGNDAVDVAETLARHSVGVVGVETCTERFFPPHLEVVANLVVDVVRGPATYEVAVTPPERFVVAHAVTGLVVALSTLPTAAE